MTTNSRASTFRIADGRSVSEPHKKHQHNKHSRGAGQQKHKITRTTRRDFVNDRLCARHQHTSQRSFGAARSLSARFHARSITLLVDVSGVLFWDQDILRFLVPWIVWHLGWRSARNDLLVLWLHSNGRRTACRYDNALACPGLQWLW